MSMQKSNILNIWFSSLFQLRKPSRGSVSCPVLLFSIWIYLKKWPPKSGNILKLCIKSRIWVWDYLKSKCLRNKRKTQCYQHPPHKTFNSSAAAVRLQSLQTESIIQSCSLHTSLLIFLPFSSTAQMTFLFPANFRLIFGTLLVKSIICPTRIHQCARCCRGSEFVSSAGDC